MQPRPLGGRQLHAHAVVHPHGVIAGACLLILMSEGHHLLTGIGSRQHGEVAQVSNTGAAEMGVAETQQHRVAIVVARAPVPATCGLCGTQLHHAEGNVGPKEHVAMSSGAYEGIDIIGKAQILTRRSLQQADSGHQGHKEASFHGRIGFNGHKVTN